MRFSPDAGEMHPWKLQKRAPAPTLLPCGQSEPTKASDLDIHNDHENDIDSDSEKDNDNDENDKNDDDDDNDDNDDDKTGDNGNDENDKNDDDDHENVKNPEKFKMWKTKTIQFFLCGCFSLKKTQARIWRQVSEDGEAQSDFMEKLHVEQFFGRHVVGEVEEKVTITCLHVCVHCKMFLVEDILWLVTAEHEERNISV